MSNHTRKANGGPVRMLSVQEAAGELGISRSLIYELFSSGALRSVKIGRRRLVPREVISAEAIMKARDVHQNNGPLKDVENRAAGRRQAGQPLRFFTKAEVAGMLGVSPRSVQRWIDSRGLVAHRLGAAVRISEADLRAFLALHRDG